MGPIHGSMENRWSPFGDEDVDLRISDQLYFLPYDSPESTTYSARDLLGGATRGVYRSSVYY